jgi:hypothetical protein
MDRGDLLFISDEAHLDAGIPGGVQICTQEYMDLLRETGFDVTVLSVSPRRDLRHRVLNRLFPDPYSRYDASSIADRAIAKIVDDEISVVAINQVSLLPVGRVLKNRLGTEITLLGLSHGNESGDTLHEVLRRSGGWTDRMTGALRLGWMMIQEARSFTDVVDLMLCMSEIEQKINAWLGAECSMVVPRTFEPDFLDWSPVPGRCGFVGTLDHLPNEEGIRRVLGVLEQEWESKASTVDLRVVGGPEDVGKELERTYSVATYCGRMSQRGFREEAATWGLFLNPIWWYARGATTKLAQAVNWGLPIVTTPPGRRGYSWSRGTIQVAETPGEMAALIVEVARNPKRCEQLAEEVRTVSRNGPTLDDLSLSLTNRLDDLEEE